MTHSPTMPSRMADPALRYALALLLVLLGAESTVSMVRGWLSGSGPSIATGFLMVVGGAGMLVGGRTALGIAAWALRIQVVVTLLVGLMAAYGAPPGAGALPFGPRWQPLLAGGFQVAVLVAALWWIAKARSRNRASTGAR